MFDFITNFLEPIALFIYLVAVIYYYKKQEVKRVRLLLAYYLASTILQTGASFKLNISGSNLWIYDLSALCTCIFIGAYFYKLLLSSLKKKIVVVLTALYIGFVIFRELNAQTLRLFDSVGYSLISISVSLYVFMYFHQLLKHVSQASILKEFNFWLAAGYLLYFVGSFFIFLSYYSLTNKILPTYTRQERDVLTALWGLHNVLLFISALSLLIGTIWISSRKKLA